MDNISQLLKKLPLFDKMPKMPRQSSLIKPIFIVHFITMLAATLLSFFTENAFPSICNSIINGNYEIKSVDFNQSKVPKYFVLRPNQSLKWVTVQYTLKTTTNEEPSSISTTYNFSNRGLSEIIKNNLGIIWNLKNKTVIDLGTGGGKFIDDLMQLPRFLQPKEAIGVDLFLPESTLEFPKKIKASITNLPLEENYFDYAFSSFSFFDYEDDPKLLKQGMNELLRVLKPHGKARLLSISAQTIELLKNYSEIGLIENYNIKKVKFQKEFIWLANFQKSGN